MGQEVVCAHRPKNHASIAVRCQSFGREHCGCHLSNKNIGIRISGRVFGGALVGAAPVRSWRPDRGESRTRDGKWIRLRWRDWMIIHRNGFLGCAGSRA